MKASVKILHYCERKSYRKFESVVKRLIYSQKNSFELKLFFRFLFLFFLFFLFLFGEKVSPSNLVAMLNVTMIVGNQDKEQNLSEHFQVAYI